jgi:beta-glucosidase-like glycosyl hydrolase
MLMTPVGDPAKLVEAATGYPNLHLIIDALGGAVARVGPGDTAFPYRSALASVQIYLKTTPAAQADAARQVHAVRDELVPVTGTAGYVNYIDATMPNWATAYYGANLPRLRTVATTYDPNQVFTFAQAVNRA